MRLFISEPMDGIEPSILRLRSVRFTTKLHRQHPYFTQKQVGLRVVHGAGCINDPSWLYGPPFYIK